MASDTRKRPPTTPPDVAAKVAKRRAYIVNVLAQRGHTTFDQLAELVVTEGLAPPGYRRGNAYRDFRKAIDGLRDEQKIEHLRGMQNRRIAMLVAACMPGALRQDWNAHAALVRWFKREAELNGMDLPTRHEQDTVAASTVAGELSALVLAAALNALPGLDKADRQLALEAADARLSILASEVDDDDVIDAEIVEEPA